MGQRKALHRKWSWLVQYFWDSLQTDVRSESFKNAFPHFCGILCFIFFRAVWCLSTRRHFNCVMARFGRVHPAYICHIIYGCLLSFIYVCTQHLMFHFSTCCFSLQSWVLTFWAWMICFAGWCVSRSRLNESQKKIVDCQLVRMLWEARSPVLIRLRLEAIKANCAGQHGQAETGWDEGEDRLSQVTIFKNGADPGLISWKFLSVQNLSLITCYMLLPVKKQNQTIPYIKYLLCIFLPS